MNRKPHPDEVADAFSGVDSDVLWDLRWADLLEVENGSVKVTDNTRMFAFILRRLFPAESHSDE